ncbi:MAG TPA: RHS repeat-associated core domain-containing protein, partial [Ktedonobacteraceae bacterium]|nr:RHS repeat-associated core domain-containing protein [Ktedonobacteraceae bacterium]
YSYSYPLAVAPGPAGFAPQLQLSYSSQSTNQRYSRRAPAGDEGEGFSLSLGSITSAQYPSNSAGGSATWYSLNGVDGVSDKLIPIPNQSGFYETQHISHLLIHYTGSCWQVWGKDGTFEQLGCTSDSLQKNSSGTYEWDVNLILAPYNDKTQAKMMSISYLQDSPSSGVIRDAGMKQIQYGLADLSNNDSWTQIIGTVDFHYHMPAVPSGQSAFATAYGNNYNCASAPPSTTTLRCDDPAPYNNAAVGLQPAPDVMATMSLDSITSYIGSDNTGHPAYKYAFTYQDYPYTTGYYSSYALIQESAAGEHLLKSIIPTVYLNGTAHTRKPMVFGYTGNLQDVYRDPSQKVQNGSQQYGGQTFWQYLNFYQDQQTGTGARINYAEAFGNTHGTPDATDSSGNIIDDRFDPLFCDNQPTCNGVYLHPEDYSWSTQVVTQISALGTDSSGNTTVATTQYDYGLASIDLSNMPVSNCNPVTGSGVPDWESDCVGDTWVPETSSGGKDGDWMDYYHAEFRGFNNVQIISSSNDLTVDWYISTAGWWTPADWSTNYNSGQLFQEDVYQGTSQAAGTWLSEMYRDYPGNSNYPELELCDTSTNVIYTPCMVGPLTERHTTYNGNSDQNNAPWTVTTYTYDDISTSTGYISTGYHNLTQAVMTSANMPTLTQKWSYAITNMNNNWQYYTVDKPIHSEIDDANGHVWNCQDITYDEGAPSGVPTPDAGLVTTAKTYSTCGNSSTVLTLYVAYDQYGNVVATVDPLAAANASLYSGHGCSASNVVDLSAAWTAGRFTSCTTYDTANTAALPVTQTNALGQASSTAYDYTSGALPTSVTDANGQVSSDSVSYDANGNETISVKQPGETGAYTTRQSEATSCTSSSTLPCYEIDANSLLYPNAISRTFYDQLGRAIETRTPGPTSGDDMVVETVYNDQNHTVWKSVPFQVADGSGWLDPTTTTDMNGNLPAGTTTFYDALGRVIATQDPNFGSTQEPGIACSTVLTGTYTACVNYGWGQALGDSNQYAITTNVDANGHVTASFTNTAGQVRYTQTFSGVYSGTLTPIQQTQTQYNALGEPTSVAVVDENPQSGQSVTGVSTTATYDDLGRLLTLSDPDQGMFSYTYDPDGHVLAATQTSGSNSRTIGMNDDLLGRVGCEQTAAPTINWNGACSAGSPLVQNTYDTTEIGTQGSTDFPVGHLTQSIATTYFPDGTSATTTDQFQYDQRGRTTTAQMQLSLPASWSVSTVLPIFQLTQAYNDADQPTTTNTNASGYGYTFTQVYDATTGVLTGLSNNAGTTANLATLAYNVNALPSQISFQTSTGSSGLAIEQFGYDGDLRPTSTSAIWASGSGQSGNLFNQTRTYDNAGNVTSLTTTQAQIQGQSASGGSQTENYCYDEQDRLLWAGNSGTQPGAGSGTCGAGTLGNTLSGAGYSGGYAYTNLSQLWQGPAAGSGQLLQYLYCDSAHPHRLTGIYPLGTTCANPSGATYTASYDPWGNMTSRTYNGVTATLSYDTLNHLVQWSAGSAGQQQYVYDASGQRALTRTASGSAPGMTVYAFGLQELQYHTDGTPVGGTSNSYYYSLGGQIIGKFDGANTIFFISDGLGSIVASFSNTAGSAAVLGNQTYEPYGKSQYQQGSLGTSKGYTGQYNDSLSGLDYYNARYYDPVSGQFLSPDDVQGNTQGMDPYSYVGGNPETDTDPTGHFRITDPEFLIADEEVVASAVFDPLALVFLVVQRVPEELADHLKPVHTAHNPESDNSGLRFARNSGTEWDEADGENAPDVAGTPLNVTGPRDFGRGGSGGPPKKPPVVTPPPLDGPDGSGGTGGECYFRGTSPGYPGNPGVQRIGVSPVSTDPAVATAFAIKAETNYGSGIVYIASRADLAGVEITEGNVLAALEKEVAVWVSPLEFAERASITINAATARGILNDMGISLPRSISSDISSVLRELPTLSPEQIAQFVQSAGEVCE